MRTEFVNDETNINTSIFNEYFKYQSPTVLLTDIHKGGKTKNEKMVNNVNNALMDLRNAVTKKRVLKIGN